MRASNLLAWVVTRLPSSSRCLVARLRRVRRTISTRRSIICTFRAWKRRRLSPPHPIQRILRLLPRLAQIDPVVQVDLGQFSSLAVRSSLIRVRDYAAVRRHHGRREGHEDSVFEGVPPRVAHGSGREGENT